MKNKLSFKDFRQKYIFKKGFLGWLIALYWWIKE